MTNFIVIEKDSLNKSTVNATQITLTEASIVHTKMSRDDVDEFIRDGNNLVLKLKNGEVVVIENFFITYDDVASDLVFEEDGCVLYWFDGTSGFNSIPGLEVLLPEAGSKLGALLPWLVGAGVVGGIIAATDDNKKDSVPNGTNALKVNTDGTVTGKTENIPEGTDVKITISGKDKDGNDIEYEDVVKVDKDGNYVTDVPPNFADGDLVVESEVIDRNGNTITAEDKLGTGKTDDPTTPGDESEGLDRVDGSITVKVDNKGNITGGTKDVEPGSEVKLTITGQDKDGNPLVDTTVTAIVQPDGSYTAQVPADFADGDLTVKAETEDRNGKPVDAEDKLGTGKTDDPTTPGDESEGLDRVDGSITVKVDNKGNITGGTKDVEPGSEVKLTITGQDKDGNPLVDTTVTAIVQPDGSYTAQVPADFADGDLTVKAETEDRNGKPVDAEDKLGTGKTDDPTTPGDESEGLDRVDGSITVKVDNKGNITGGTKDVEPGSEVKLTITGQDKDGNPLVDTTVTAIVQPDGSYTAQVPADFADGDLTVKAETEDRNGKPVDAEDKLGTGKTDDPTTPGDESEGLDRVDGSITVKVDNKGNITGGTKDVEPGSEVKLTITGQDKDGNPLVDTTVTAIVQPDGSYTAQVPADFADGDLTVKAETEDRNGKPVDAEDKLGTGKTDDPTTPGDESEGLDRVDGSITVKVDNKGNITGGTKDVEPGSEVKLTITGQDKDGNPLVDTTVTAIVQPDGSYTAQVPADFADGDLTVKAETEDRNGKPVDAEDKLGTGKTDDPTTPGDESEGLDRVDGSITVKVDNKGNITGGTKDVEPGSEVKLTITGQDKDGNPLVDTTVTAIVQPDGSYTAQVPADFADGDLTVKAETEDRNGKPVDAEDKLGTGKTDDPTTPGDESEGLDRVDGSITVKVDNKGNITGGTKDVEPGSEVKLTITGQDKDGNPLVDTTVTAIVQPDGSYTAQVPADFADGDLTVKAETEDRNGKPVDAEDKLGTGKTDDPTTPGDESEGLDRVDGSITVKVDNKGNITGGTKDVEPGSEVKLTITGQDKDGNPLVDTTVTAIVQPDGSYTAQVPADFADGDLTVKAETEDRNGKPVDAEDKLGTGKTDDPTTPGDESEGLDRVDGSITVKVDNKGNITGGTKDVEPGSEVKLTITGQDKDGNPLVDTTVTAIVQPDGSYTAQVPADFADGDLTVKAETEDRNGKPVDAEDKLGTGKTDDPTTPGDESEGLDRVDGSITVKVDNKGNITGGTKDVEPGSEVKLTITGQDKDGNPLVDTTVTAIVQPDGSYTAQVPADFADGDLTVKAETEDRNGKPVDAEDKLGTGKTDDPTTPGDESEGLDRVDGSITVKVDNKGNITGGTKDVEPGSEVKLTITGQDKDGNPLVDTTVTAIVQPDGSYTAQVPADFADGDLTVKAETEDRNGKPVDAEDKLGTGKTDDPATPGDESEGLDRVDGSITVKVDNKGNITGGTKDVEPGSEVKLTITGQDKDGNPLVDTTVTAIVQPDGSYTAQVPADFADGDLTVKAETEDRNGKPVDAEDKLGTGKTDDPATPGDESEGLDRVDGAITVDIVDTDSTQITGTTEDVAPNSKVTLEITSIDENGETLTFTKEVFTNADGEYNYTLTSAQGNASQVIAKVDDRNGNQRQDNDQFDIVNEDAKTEVDGNGNDTLTGTSGNDVLSGDTGGLKTNFVAGNDYNISIVLDLSGSMNYRLASDSDPSNGELSRLEIAKLGLKAFIQQMVMHDGVINLQLASFSSSGYAGNNYNKSWKVSKDNLKDIFDYIDGLTAAGGTNPNRGWTKAENWFDGNISGLEKDSVVADTSYENQTYFLTDGKPNTYNGTGANPTSTDYSKYDADFTKLASKGKIFAVGVGTALGVQDAVSRFDNTDINGDKIESWSSTNHGEAKAIADAEKLIAYLIGGSENLSPANVGSDVVKGAAGNDILFGDAMNTDWITGLDPLLYPKYSGYSKLIAHLKANVTSDLEPTQQEIYDFVKANFQKFVDADAIDSATKGGNDTIYGGSGNDIIIAGAGNDIIYGGSGNDIISTGRGDDTIMYDVLNAADAKGGNGTDTWVDYAANDQIEFGADFFEGLLADKSNISEYIKVEDVNGKAVLKVDRDGAADASGGTTHDWADLLIIEGKTASELQDLINNQIIIG